MNADEINSILDLMFLVGGKAGFSIISAPTGEVLAIADHEMHYLQ